MMRQPRMAGHPSCNRVMLNRNKRQHPHVVHLHSPREIAENTRFFLLALTSSRNTTAFLP